MQKVKLRKKPFAFVAIAASIICGVLSLAPHSAYALNFDWGSRSISVPDTVGESAEYSFDIGAYLRGRSYDAGGQRTGQVQIYRYTPGTGYGRTDWVSSSSLVGSGTLFEQEMTSVNTGGKPFKVEITYPVQNKNGSTSSATYSYVVLGDNASSVAKLSFTWDLNFLEYGDGYNNGFYDGGQGCRLYSVDSSGSQSQLFSNTRNRVLNEKWGYEVGNSINYLHYSIKVTRLADDGSGDQDNKISATVTYEDGAAYNGEWTNHDLKIAVNNSYEGSKVDFYRDAIGANNAWNGNGINRPIASIDEALGTYKLPTESTSNAGNYLIVTALKNGSMQGAYKVPQVIRIDKTAPVVNSATYNASTGKVSVDATDSLSGVKSIEVKSDTSWIDAESYTAPAKEAPSTLTIRVTDNAGNVTLCTVAVNGGGGSGGGDQVPSGQGDGYAIKTS